jgi:hypothetical protein
MNTATTKARIQPEKRYGQAEVLQSLPSRRPRCDDETLPLGAGTSELALTTASPALTGSLVLVIDGAVIGVASEPRPTTLPARLTAAAVAPGAVVLAIVEAAASTTTAPVAFGLDVMLGPAPPGVQ